MMKAVVVAELALIEAVALSGGEIPKIAGDARVEGITRSVKDRRPRQQHPDQAQVQGVGWQRVGYTRGPRRPQSDLRQVRLRRPARSGAGQDCCAFGEIERVRR